MSWGEDVRARFPDWRTPDAKWRWVTVRETLRVGQKVSGEVIARAPFGVWLDVGVGYPALLLVPNMEGATERRIQFEDYPPLGATVEGHIIALAEQGEIGITQHALDRGSDFIPDLAEMLPPADQSLEELAQRLRSTGWSPEEFAARRGRNVEVCSIHRYRYRSPETQAWVSRLAEILRTPALLEQCEEQFLTPEELAEVGLSRGRQTLQTVIANRCAK